MELQLLHSIRAAELLVETCLSGGLDCALLCTANLTGGTGTSRIGCLPPWEIAASPCAASMLFTQSEIVLNIETTYRSPATEGSTTASWRHLPDTRSRTCSATHACGVNPMRAHQQRNRLTQ